MQYVIDIMIRPSAYISFHMLIRLQNNGAGNILLNLFIFVQVVQ